MVKILLSHESIDANLKDNENLTPLAWAVRGNNLDVVRFFIQNDQINVDLNDQDGAALLSFVIEHERHDWYDSYDCFDDILLMLEKDRAYPCQNDESIALLLKLAAIRGKVEIFDALKGREWVDFNLKDQYNHSPIWYAADNGQLEVVKILLATKGLELGWIDTIEQHTPLSRAFMWLDNVAKKLIYEGKMKRYPPSHSEEYTKGIALVKILGLRENPDSFEKRTLLSWTAAMGHEAILQGLLWESTNELNKPDEEGRTPLSYAVMEGHAEVVRLLCSRMEIDVVLKDQKGRTPLYWAAVNGREDLAKLILAVQAGSSWATSSLSQNDGITLHQLCHEGQLSAVRILLEAGCDPKAEDVHGRTALHLVAGSKHAEVAHILIDNGADVNAEDPDGMTALRLALQRHDRKLVELLLLNHSPRLEGITRDEWLDCFGNNYKDVVLELLRDSRGKQTLLSKEGIELFRDSDGTEGTINLQ